MTIQYIAAETLKNTPPTTGVLVDVRTKAEHTSLCLACPHVHQPLNQLNVDLFSKQHNLSPTTPVYVLCQSGARAEKAAAMFTKAGFTQVFVVTGGLGACTSCGVAVKRSGKTAISLERQVRIAAGLLVFIGALCALLFHPLWALLPLAVGAGLVFAGLSNWCGMALLLAQAPWNRSSL